MRRRDILKFILYFCVIVPGFVNAQANVKNCGLNEEILKVIPSPNSEAIVLFKKLGPPEAGYERLIAKLRRGDFNGKVIQFGDGSKHVVHEIIGEGGDALIIDIGKEYAVRIPNSRDGRVVEVFNDFRRLQPQLKKAGVPVVEMDVERSIPSQKIMVRREKLRFTLYDYLYENAGANLEPKQKKEIESQLIEFARKTWQYENIGDFNAAQMGFNEEGKWVLFDFADSASSSMTIVAYDLKSNQNLFSPVGVPGFDRHDKKLWSNIVPKELYSKIEAAIADERRIQRKKANWFQRSGDHRTNLIDQYIPDPIPEGDIITRPQTFVFSDRSDLRKGGHYLPELNLAVVKHLPDDKNLGVYEVKLEDGRSALLKVSRSEDKRSEKKIQKLVKKFTKKHMLIESGSDFVLLKPNMDSK